jgi:hypothetical protein
MRFELAFEQRTERDSRFRRELTVIAEGYKIWQMTACAGFVSGESAYGKYELEWYRVSSLRL